MVDGANVRAWVSLVNFIYKLSVLRTNGSCMYTSQQFIIKGFLRELDKIISKRHKRTSDCLDINWDRFDMKTVIDQIWESILKDNDIYEIVYKAAKIDIKIDI